MEKQKYFDRLHELLLQQDEDYKSGYEYATRNAERLWIRNGTQELLFLVKTYIHLAITLHDSRYMAFARAIREIIWRSESPERTATA